MISHRWRANNRCRTDCGRSKPLSRSTCKWPFKDSWPSTPSPLPKMLWMAQPAVITSMCVSSRLAWRDGRLAHVCGPARKGNTRPHVRQSRLHLNQDNGVCGHTNSTKCVCVSQEGRLLTCGTPTPIPLVRRPHECILKLLGLLHGRTRRMSEQTSKQASPVHKGRLKHHERHRMDESCKYESSGKSLKLGGGGGVGPDLDAPMNDPVSTRNDGDAACPRPNRSGLDRILGRRPCLASRRPIQLLH